MNDMRIINRSEQSKMLFQSTWLIEKTVEFAELIIRERAVLTAPEGKAVTLIVNGVVRDKKPGKYTGRVLLYVSDRYYARPEGLMAFNQIHAPMTPAICVENGRLSAEKCIPEAVWGQGVTDREAEGIYIGAAAESFNGIIVDNSAYQIKNARMDLEGFGCNDYAGSGAAVAAVGKSQVEISDSAFNMAGVTRCAVHAGGDSRVRVTNCDILNISPETHWLGRFCWQLPLRGSNRLCQLAGNAQVEYVNCCLKTNGWGILSIDGSDEFVRMTVKDCKLELSGPRSHGYGTFCIGPNEVNLDHSLVDVYGYPMLIMGMGGKGRANITNSSLIKGRRFGAMVIADDNSVFNITDSAFDTGSANIVVKASATTINIDRSEMKSGRGVLLQLMDTEESGMDVVKYFVPVGVRDSYVAGRDLTAVSERDDVILNISNTRIAGDILNSTTNIRAHLNSEKGGMGAFHDTVIGPVGFSGPADDPSAGAESAGRDAEALRGPKNLGVNLKNARIEGVISSALQAHRQGVTEIGPENWQELSEITQTPAPPVNNGVVLTLDGASRWTVTGVSYLTGLELCAGAQIEGPDGRMAGMTINGEKITIAAGTYAGLIEIRPE